MISSRIKAYGGEEWGLQMFDKSRWTCKSHRNGRQEGDLSMKHTEEDLDKVTALKRVKLQSGTCRSQIIEKWDASNLNIFWELSWLEELVNENIFNLLLIFLRQDIFKTTQDCNLLCRPGWSQIYKEVPAYDFLIVGINGLCRYTWPCFLFLITYTKCYTEHMWQPEDNL